MSLQLTGLVLLAALMHASWSALAYRFHDQEAGFAMLGLASMPLSLTLVLSSPPPAMASLPFLIVSTLVHVAYTLGLVRANKVAHFSQLYPISRGFAPVIVTGVMLSGLAGVDEDLNGRQLAALSIVLLGILMLSTTRIRGEDWQPAPLIIAFTIAGLIASYTVVDGVGVRKAESVLGYMGWMSLGLNIVATGWLTRRADVRTRMRRAPDLWRPAAWGAVLSFGAYCLVMWAQAHGSVSMVAALRETSVVFAALIGVVVFGEGWGARRVVAALAVAVGLAILHAG